MKRWMHYLMAVIVSIMLTSGVLTSIADAAEVSINDVPRMSKDVLKEELDNPDFVILDVRSKSQWKASEWKIKGSIWEDSTEFESWANFKYSRTKTFVLSCA